MTNMAHNLPDDQAQLVGPQAVYQYVPTPHAQVIFNPIQSSRYYPVTHWCPYGNPYALATTHYPFYHLAPAHSYNLFHGGNLPILYRMGTAGAYNTNGFHYTPAYSGAFGPHEPRDSFKVQAKTRRGCRGGYHKKSKVVNKESERQAKVTNNITKTIAGDSSSSRLTLKLPVVIGPGSDLPSSIVKTTQSISEKLKLSGCVLWVGNLPKDANLVELKDHFSQEATNDIRSVFLISKSNCAFVNYRSAHACAAALARFHHSSCHGVRLVCRLRKEFRIPGSEFTVAATTARRFPEEADPPEMRDSITNPPKKADGHTVNRFFIMKSFTVEDLELSKKNGIWATQSHNEASLTRASETADNVYLIFSANRSGEYFGYARMMSPITDKESSTVKAPSRSAPIFGSQGDLEVNLTPATVTAPPGLVINDATRGSMFWKTESSKGENEEHYGDKRVDKRVDTRDGHLSEARSFGRPFEIEWKSTDRVPFCRTRGLCNPWNANREVKIARDGTEVEPKVGRHLIQMFDQC